MDNLSEQFFKALEQHKIEGLDLTWPSFSFKELKMSVSGVQSGKNIVFILPSNPKYQDPLGFIHPGYLSFAFNECFYCLAFSLARKPCIPIHTEFSLIEPVPANSAALTLEISVSAKSRKFLFLTGKALNYRNKVHALASAIITPYSLPTHNDTETK